MANNPNKGLMFYNVINWINCTKTNLFVGTHSQLIRLIFVFVKSSYIPGHKKYSFDMQLSNGLNIYLCKVVIIVNNNVFHTLLLDTYMCLIKYYPLKR